MSSLFKTVFLNCNFVSIFLVTVFVFFNFCKFHQRPLSHLPSRFLYYFEFLFSSSYLSFQDSAKHATEQDLERETLRVRYTVCVCVSVRVCVCMSVCLFTCRSVCL